MTLTDIVKDKLNRINSVPDEFVNRVDKANVAIFNLILDELNRLEVVDGKIVLSQKNLEISEQITTNLRKTIFDTDYLDALKKYAGQFDKQADLNNEYFEKAFGDFQNEDIFKSILDASKLSAIELLSEDAVYKEFINPVKDILNGSISAGGTFTDAIKTLRDYTLGTNETTPALTKYVKQIAYDSFAFSDRQYSKTISESLGNDWYKYSGGELPDSRPFCVEYHNQFFHKREIEDFGNGKNLDGKDLTDEMLQGRYPETNSSTIFTFAGGYNCKHTYLPVSEVSIPKAVIERNILKGYIKDLDSDRLITIYFSARDADFTGKHGQFTSSDMLNAKAYIKVPWAGSPESNDYALYQAQIKLSDITQKIDVGGKTWQDIPHPKTGKKVTTEDLRIEWKGEQKIVEIKNIQDVGIFGKVEKEVVTNYFISHPNLLKNLVKIQDAHKPFTKK